MGRRRRGGKKLPQGSFEAQIESLSHDGRGVTHVSGKTVFIHGALPGEKVTFNYSRVQRRYDEGVVDEILQASSQRVEPGCENFPVCGGCSLQHLGSDYQITYKQQTLLDAFEHIAGIELQTVMPPLVSEPWGYRRKARLGVKYVAKKGRVLIGFRERGSSFITVMQRCPVLHPAIGEKLGALADVIQSLSVRDKLPQIEVAMGDEAVILIFRLLSPLSAEDAEILGSYCRGQHWHCYIQEGGPQTVTPLEGDAVTLSYQLPQQQLQFEFLPTDFTQVNTTINRQMISQAMLWLKPQSDEVILDLFCGLGNFTLPLAQLCSSVTGIEGDVALVERARKNADNNGITNADFHVANLYEPGDDQSWMQQQYDAVLLDPPRSGAQEILPWLPRLGARRILYVSCYPGTLARDAGLLVNEHGYKLLQAGVMDMFPHTAHVESMALFERK
ncbi:MAG: 23S rRNA (uracil(1939)-C(5))-methyltransferase RlmD [Pseudomonadota bacterium]|nr:23S rRNA (uracil(1939)-C(5))-methyltransferase RlmD [Pseudomonadota bacterium]